MSAVVLRLSAEKILIACIDECLDFLGWHIQRHRKQPAAPRGRTPEN